MVIYKMETMLLKIYRVVAIVYIVTTLVSCIKETESSSKPMTLTSITAISEQMLSETKTSIDENLYFSWLTNDEINVFFGKSVSSKFT